MRTSSLATLSPPGCGPSGCSAVGTLNLEPEVQSFCFRQNGGGFSCAGVDGTVVAYSGLVTGDSYSVSAINGVLQAALTDTATLMSPGSTPTPGNSASDHTEGQAAAAEDGGPASTLERRRHHSRTVRSPPRIATMPAAVK